MEKSALGSTRYRTGHITGCVSDQGTRICSPASAPFPLLFLQAGGPFINPLQALEAACERQVVSVVGVLMGGNVSAAQRGLMENVIITKVRGLLIGGTLVDVCLYYFCMRLHT